MKAASAQPLKGKRTDGRRSPARARARTSLRGELAGVVRRAILDAAEQVFGARGFSAAKMAEIAEGAGLASGTLYNYFASKEEIFRALVEQRAEEFIGGLDAIVAADGGARHQLIELTRTTFRFIEAHSAVFVLMSQPEAADKTVRRACGGSGERPCRRYLQIFERCLELGSREGLVSDALSASELAQLFTGSLEGLVRGWFLRGGRAGQLSGRAAFVVDLFLRGASKNE